jgi:hypothetical protein
MYLYLNLNKIIRNDDFIRRPWPPLHGPPEA